MHVIVTMNNRIDILSHCNFAKMVLMLCVITCHSCAFWNGRWFSYLTPTFDNFAVGMFADWLGSFQIPAFVLISGFIYSYIIDNMNSYSQSLKFIKKKATRLLLPYYFVTIIWLLPIHYFIYGDIDKVLIARYLMGGVNNYGSCICYFSFS